MRPRTIHVTTLLAAALGAGCAEKAAPVTAEPVPAKVASAPPAMDARREPPAEPARPRDGGADVHALRDLLADTTPAQAMAQAAVFRPLCDAQGYPLVGNTVRKGGPVLTQPSEVCAEVRRREARR